MYARKTIDEVRQALQRIPTPRTPQEFDEFRRAYGRVLQAYGWTMREYLERKGDSGESGIRKAVKGP